MTQADLHTWHPASFVEHVRTLERDEFLETYGAGLFLLVAISGDTDPMLPSLAVSSRLLDRMRIRRGAQPSVTTGVHTLSQHQSEAAHASDMVVPVNVSAEPRFVVSVEPARDADPEQAERVVVGRSNDADVLLRHASVSKRHAAFLLDQIGSIGLCDLGSKNGTQINGERLDTPGARVELSNGDELRFGNVQALVCDAIALWTTMAAGR